MKSWATVFKQILPSDWLVGSGPSKISTKCLKHGKSTSTDLYVIEIWSLFLSGLLICQAQKYSGICPNGKSGPCSFPLDPFNIPVPRQPNTNQAFIIVDIIVINCYWFSGYCNKRAGPIKNPSQRCLNSSV